MLTSFPGAEEPSPSLPAHAGDVGPDHSPPSGEVSRFNCAQCQKNRKTCPSGFGDEWKTVRISYTVLSVISNFFPGLRFAFTRPVTFPHEKPELQMVGC
jgi:hypothetical protein